MPAFAGLKAVSSIGGGSGGGRTLLTTTTNFYVTTTGTDSGNCTLAAPCLTINYALNNLQSKYDLGGQTVNVNVADGTYTTPVVINGPFVGGTPNIVGDITTPANCLLSTTSNGFVLNYTSLNMAGLRLVITVASGVGTELSMTGSRVTINGAMDFGPATGGTYPEQILLAQRSSLQATANYTISGGGVTHIATYNSDSSLNGRTITITGTPAFTSQFIIANAVSYIDVSGMTFTGSATGTRYYASQNSIIFTNGASATYLPGNAAGSVATQGQYL